MTTTWSFDARNLSHMRKRGPSWRYTISDSSSLSKWSLAFTITCLISGIAAIFRHASISISFSLLSSVRLGGGVIAKNRISGKPDFRKRELNNCSLVDQLMKRECAVAAVRYSYIIAFVVHLRFHNLHDCLSVAVQPDGIQESQNAHVTELLFPYIHKATLLEIFRLLFIFAAQSKYMRQMRMILLFRRESRTKEYGHQEHPCD